MDAHKALGSSTPTKHVNCRVSSIGYQKEKKSPPMSHIELKNQHKTRSSPCCYCSEARHRTQTLILKRKGFLTSTVNWKKKKKNLRKGQW